MSPVQRSNRSLLLCFEDNTKKSVSVSLFRPSPAHTSEPGPRREQSLPSPRSSQLRSKLKSCLLGLSCLEISICCSNAMFNGASVTPFHNGGMLTCTHYMIPVHFGVFSKNLSEEIHLIPATHSRFPNFWNKIESQDNQL